MALGILLLSSAAFLFALSTVFLKLAVMPPCGVPAVVTTFVRFLIGFFMFSGTMAFSRQSLRPNRPVTVYLRAVLNTLAVVLFYAGLQYTTVTKANILNLTYPAFVFLLAPFIAGEQQDRRHYVYLFLTLAGAALIVLPGQGADFARINRGDILALASGIVGGFAIADLRQACKFDRPTLILFYQMSFGVFATFLLMLPSFVMPRGWGLIYVLLAGLLSNLGQYLLTEGYRHISASLGSIVLESGIFFAAVLGTAVFHDPLTLAVFAGGLLILVSIAGISGLFDRS